jgi:hypothetical protein
MISMPINYLLRNQRWRIGYDRAVKPIGVFRCLILSLILIGGSVSIAVAQVEDTTRIERKVPEEIRSNRYNSIITTPYNADLFPSGLNQYRLNDQGTSYGFYRRLNHQGTREFMFSEDSRYYPYGPEWERELNEQLMAIVQATFKEQSGILKALSRIAPFLGFGFFERYELPPPPRIEDPDRVPVEN